LNRFDIKQLTVAVIAAVALLQGCASRYSNITNIHSAFGSTVVCFGDSLTAGQGAGAGEDWPSLIGPKVALPVINRGHSGDTTANALARIDDVLKDDPLVVIVEFGANDYLRSLNMGVGAIYKSHIDAFSNLKQIVIRLQKSGAVVVIAGVRLNGDYDDGYRKLARETHSVLIPDIMAGISDNEALLSPDKVHPNAKGYKVMAENILGTIQPLLKAIKD